MNSNKGTVPKTYQKPHIESTFSPILTESGPRPHPWSARTLLAISKVIAAADKQQTP